MTTAAADPRSADLCSVELGEVVRSRGIAIAPLFPRAMPRAGYVTLAEALPLGVRVEEVDAAGSVPELRVVNRTALRVLLHDGEELIGAKQNRILDVSVLVEAGATLTIPVSCVERGRWSRRSAAISPAPHASHPELRRRKAQRMSADRTRRGAAQGEVWAAVREKSERLGVRSPTGAQSDLYAARRAEIAGLAARFPLRPGQCGMVLAFAGRAVCLDLVSRPEAFARLHRRILSGYGMDAIEHLDGPDATDADIAAFVRRAASGSWRRGPAVGLGEDLRLAGGELLGSGLALDGEVLQLSAYAGAGTL